MMQKTNFNKNSLRHKAALIFAVSSVIPLLLFLLVLEYNNLIWETEVGLMLVLSLFISSLGYLLFRRIINQISLMADDFLKAGDGNLENFGDYRVPHEISEMARIAEGFNKILIELKTNTKELENLIYKLTTLSDLTELVSHIPNIKEVLSTVLHRTMATVNARRGSIMLIDPQRQVLTIEAAEGFEEDHVVGTSVSLGEGIAGKVAQTGESMLVQDMENDLRLGKSNNSKYETSSFICMPLKTLERVIGVINLSKKGEQAVFTESDLKFLTSLLRHISFVVENARLLKEAKEAATKLQQAIQDKGQQLNLAKQQVMQAAKLSTLGELVAGVAHELNNPLTTVLGYSELLLVKARDEKIRDDLKRIVEESQRATDIIRDLLAFSRRKPPKQHPCDINHILSEVLKLGAADLLVSNIELGVELFPNLPLIMVDEGQIKDVFLNIVDNAGQAMGKQEKPGRHHITT